MRVPRFFTVILLAVSCFLLVTGMASSQDFKALARQGSKRIVPFSSSKDLRYVPGAVFRLPAPINVPWRMPQRRMIERVLERSLQKTIIDWPLKEMSSPETFRKKGAFVRTQPLASWNAISPSYHLVPFPGKTQIDAVIFDMDGTLLDSLSAWENSASNFLRSRGIEPPVNFDAEMAELSLMDGARTIKERFGLTESPEEILAATLEPILKHYETDIPAKPGAVELLVNLHEQGIKIGVATASYKEASIRAFERLGMMRYIDFVITCDEVGAGKRSPAVYDAALVQLGTAKERTLVVEDALYALQTAKVAGYPTAGVADSFHPKQHLREVISTGDYFIPSYTQGWVLKHSGKRK